VLDGGVQASVGVQFDTMTAVTNAQAGASQAIVDGSLDFTSVAGLPSASKVNPSDGVGLDSTSSTATTDNAPGSAGTMVVPSLLAVLLAGVVALL